MFTDHSTRVVAAPRTSQLDQRSTPDIRAARSLTRRRLHERRPTATPEINARIGQWKNNIKAACLAGYIGQSYDKYLHELLTISSVARGDYCLYSDKKMAQRLNLRGDGSRTVRRHRAAAAKQGLLQVLGHGKDRKPCMVRPILEDGSPVFLSRPELAGRSDTFVRLTRTTLAADILLTDTLKTDTPNGRRMQGDTAGLRQSLQSRTGLPAASQLYAMLSLAPTKQALRRTLYLQEQGPLIFLGFLKPSQKSHFKTKQPYELLPIKTNQHRS